MVLLYYRKLGCKRNYKLTSGIILKRCHLGNEAGFGGKFCVHGAASAGKLGAF